jgi:hypothetical protein
MPMPPNLIVVMTFRLIVLGIFSAFLFTSWLKSFHRTGKDFKFLFFLTFTIQIIGKIIDILLYDMNLTEGAIEADPALFVFVKIRYFILLWVIIPIYLLMVFVWFNKDKKKQIVANVLFITISSIAIIFAPTYNFLMSLITLMLLPLTILSVITFWNLYKHQRLPNFNSLLMTFAFIVLLFSNIMRPILIGAGGQSTMYLWLIELIDSVAWMMMGLSFVVKPQFAKMQEQKIVV